MGGTALVVSGGGAKGAFAVGAVDYMVNRLNLSFDLCAGTSTGALVTGCLAAGKLGELVTYYSTATTDTMLTQRTASQILGSDSVLGSKPSGWHWRGSSTNRRRTPCCGESLQSF